jgi:hypothetical protein
MCYEELIRLGVVGGEDLGLVECWSSDCAEVGSR